MQAVSIFASKRPVLVPLARVLTKSCASSIENPIKMLIFPTAYTSFCCFKCKRSVAKVCCYWSRSEAYRDTLPDRWKKNEQGHGPAFLMLLRHPGDAYQYRHRPAGGQPFSDVWTMLINDNLKPVICNLSFTIASNQSHKFIMTKYVECLSYTPRTMTPPWVFAKAE